MKSYVWLGAVVAGVLLLSGCGLDDVLAIDDYESIPYEETTYEGPWNAEPTPPPGECLGDDQMQTPAAPHKGMINVSLLPVFAGNPDMNTVDYDDGLGEYTHEFDPHRALLVLVSGSQFHEFRPHEVADFSFRPAEMDERGYWICGDPIETTVTYVGATDATDRFDVAGLWEISSETPFFGWGSKGYVTLEAMGTAIAGDVDSYYVKRPEQADLDAVHSKKAPAFRDLRHYYEHLPEK